MNTTPIIVNGTRIYKDRAMLGNIGEAGRQAYIKRWFNRFIDVCLLAATLAMWAACGILAAACLQ